MMNYLDYLNKTYPVRRTEQEKEKFRGYVLDLMAEKGMDARVETTMDCKNDNIVIGDPASAKVVFTAHYDTPAAALFPNIMIPRNRLLFYLYQFAPVVVMLAAALGGAYLIAEAVVGERTQQYMQVFFLVYMAIYYGLFFLMYRAFKNPNNFNDNTSGVATVLSVIENLSEEQRKAGAFILFDNEEKGKKGSKAYFKDHKDAMENRLLVNFDCVGNGENIIFIAMKEAENRGEFQKLQECFPDSDGFRTYFHSGKDSESNSDHKNFPRGIGCMACRKSKGGVFYTPNIHTPRDTVADNKNIEFITGGMVRFLSVL